MSGPLLPSPTVVGHTWTVVLPAGMTLLNENDRLHWRPKNERFQALKQAAYILARTARIPACERIHVVAEMRPRDRRKLDVHNWMPSAKAAIDGLVAAGVILDDHQAHLDGPDMRLGDTPVKGGQLVLHITALAAD